MVNLLLLSVRCCERRNVRLFPMIVKQFRRLMKDFRQEVDVILTLPRTPPCDNTMEHLINHIKHKYFKPDDKISFEIKVVFAPLVVVCIVVVLVIRIVRCATISKLLRFLHGFIENMKFW